MKSIPQNSDLLQPVPAWVQRVAWILVCGLAINAERLRWTNPKTRLEALTGWLAGPQADWLPFLPILLLVFFWRNIRGRKAAQQHRSGVADWLQRSARTSRAARGEWFIAAVLFGLAFTVSRATGMPFEGWPPAFHDEYSYLFQAQTYLAGRLWFPSTSVHPEWFNQMHVLNEGHFASRYFPGVGLWLAPFLALGDPWLGQQIAQAIAAVLVFWIGRELSSNGTGVLASILFSLSPGMILFSNLLLAHHPTLIGLLLFTWAFLRWMRQGSALLLVLAGSGLAFAMLCRPMTAAGFGLPFGVLFAFRWMSGRPRGLRSMNRSAADDATNGASLPHPPGFRQRSLSALLLALPLVGGFVVVFLTNRAITGDALISPYQLYTDLYTPRHRYGFYNVTKGEQRIGPKVLDNYDRWAEELTPRLAVRNDGVRWQQSLRWTMGIVPLLLGGLVSLLTLGTADRRWGLIWAAIFCLHLVHLPYWFTGIMGWHYVLESAPLWILVFAGGSARLVDTWHAERKSGLIWWGGTLVLTALAVNLLPVPPLWPGRLEQGLAEIAFPRRRYQDFREQVEQLRNGQPAIVFVLPDASDRHMDYVTNRPDLSGPVVIARIQDRAEIPSGVAAFPDRVPLLFDAAQRKLSAIQPPGSHL